MSKGSSSSGARLRAIALEIFALPLVGVGALLIFLSVLEARKAQWVIASVLFFTGVIPAVIGITLLWWANSRGTSAADAASPWLRRTDWRSGRICFSFRNQALQAWLTSLAFAAPACLFSYFLIPMMLADHAYVPMFFVAIFPLIALLLLGRAVRLTYRWASLGESFFQMDSSPASPGGTISGQIQLSKEFIADAGFQVSLICAERWLTGGRGRHAHVLSIWEAKQEIQSDGRFIPISFPIPKEGICTGEAHNFHRVIWRLSATAQNNGRKFYAAFEVPIFRKEAAAAAD